MIINVKMISALKRSTMPLESSEVTPAMAFEKADMTTNGCMANLNGNTLSAAEMNMTFEELGITDTCFLMADKKRDNA